MLWTYINDGGQWYIPNLTKINKKKHISTSLYRIRSSQMDTNPHLWWISPGQGLVVTGDSSHLWRASILISRHRWASPHAHVWLQPVTVRYLRRVQSLCPLGDSPLMDWSNKAVTDESHVTVFVYDPSVMTYFRKTIISKYWLDSWFASHTLWKKKHHICPSHTQYHIFSILAQMHPKINIMHTCIPNFYINYIDSHIFPPHISFEPVKTQTYPISCRKLTQVTYSLCLLKNNDNQPFQKS